MQYMERCRFKAIIIISEVIPLDKVKVLTVARDVEQITGLVRIALERCTTAEEFRTLLRFAFDRLLDVQEQTQLQAKVIETECVKEEKKG